MEAEIRSVSSAAVTLADKSRELDLSLCGMAERQAQGLADLAESAFKREGFAWVGGVLTTAISATVTAGVTWLILGPR